MASTVKIVGEHSSNRKHPRECLERETKDRESMTESERNEEVRVEAKRPAPPNDRQDRQDRQDMQGKQGKQGRQDRQGRQDS